MRRILVLIVVSILIAVVVGTTFTVRANLAENRDTVDATWTPVAEAMSARADAISLLAEAIGEISETQREVVDEAREEVALWWEAIEQDESTAVQVTIANSLEGLAARLATTVAGSSVLSADERVDESLVRLRESVVPAGFVEVYNDAVKSYDDRRGSFVGRPVASLFGFDAAVAFAPVALPPPVETPPEEPAEVTEETPAPS